MDHLPRKLLRWWCLLLGYGFLLRAIFGFLFASTQEEIWKLGSAALISMSSFLLVLVISGGQRS